jgi:hypothetical protein
MILLLRTASRHFASFLRRWIIFSLLASPLGLPVANLDQICVKRI